MSNKVKTRAKLHWCDGTEVVDAEGGKAPLKKILQMVNLMWGVVEVAGPPTIEDWYENEPRKRLAIPRGSHLVGLTVEQKPKKKWVPVVTKETICAHTALKEITEEKPSLGEPPYGRIQYPGR